MTELEIFEHLCKAWINSWEGEEDVGVIGLSVNAEGNQSGRIVYFWEIVDLIDPDLYTGDNGGGVIARHENLGGALKIAYKRLGVPYPEEASNYQTIRKHQMTRTGLSKKLKKVTIPKTRAAPVWEGPCGEGPQGGVTQSLLGRWLSCRERFRLLVVDGLKPQPEFSPRIHYGELWHACEEGLAANDDWTTRLQLSASIMAQQFPQQGQQVEHWYNVCKAQFPVYVNFWRKHIDVKQRTPLIQEGTFDVPHQLDSGRVVRLRGKWDSVDVIGKGKQAAIYLQENKTKGDINEQQLQQQLRFDLQTMLYLIALKGEQRRAVEGNNIIGHAGLFTKYLRTTIAGVRYNVIRRPLSGGKYSIRQHQPSKSNPTGETAKEFYGRLSGLLASDPEYFFMRWRVEISAGDIERFKCICLNPILEQLCDWWQVVAPDSKCKRWAGPIALNYLMPHGVYNPTLEGRPSELDEYILTGSELGLVRVDSLFKELE